MAHNCSRNNNSGSRDVAHTNVSTKFDEIKMTDRHRLSIAIPAYYRSEEVQRLLSQLEKQIIKHKLYQDVEVLISSNGGIDGDKLHIDKRISYAFHENEFNLGFDLNVLQCVRLSNFEYVWLFGSDDHLEEDKLLDLLSYLKGNSDVVLLPFRQPEKMVAPTKEYSLNLRQVSLDRKISIILLTGKITSYVLKRKNLKLDILDSLKPEKAHGWMHMILALTALDLGDKRLDVYPKFLAFSLDSEAKKLSGFPPPVYTNYPVLFSHPLCNLLSNRVKKDVAKKYKFTELYLLYKVLNKSWDSPIRDQYIEYFEKHKRRLFSLFPKSLFFFVVSLLNLNAR